MKKVLAILLVLLCVSALGEHEYIEAITDYNGVYVMNAWDGATRTMLTIIMNPNGTAGMGITQSGRGSRDSASLYAGTWEGNKVDCDVMWCTILGAWQDVYGQMWIDVDVAGLSGRLGVYSCMMVKELAVQ